MPFPGTAKKSLKDAYDIVTGISQGIKDRADSMIASTSITRMAVLQYLNSLADALDLLSPYTSLPGIQDYIRTQLGVATFDVNAEYLAMRTQIEAVQTWIVSNFPHDASGNAAVYAFDANKRFINVNLTAPQMTAFKAQLSALSATIGTPA